MKLIGQLENILTIGSQIETIRDELEDINMEEEMARDNTPESLQDTERYAESERISDCLENAIENLEEAVSLIQSAGEELEDI